MLLKDSASACLLRLQRHPQDLAGAVRGSGGVGAGWQSYSEPPRQQQMERDAAQLATERSGAQEVELCQLNAGAALRPASSAPEVAVLEEEAPGELRRAWSVAY